MQKGVFHMISKKLSEDMKVALKSGDKVKLSVVRMLLSELKNAQLAADHDLTDADEEKVVATYAKKRMEAMEAYKQAGREDLVEKEKQEYEITMAYLPPRMGEDELKKLIAEKAEELGAESMKDFGRVMKAVMASVGSRAEGSMVSGLVKKVMSERS